MPSADWCSTLFAINFNPIAAVCEKPTLQTASRLEIFDAAMGPYSEIARLVPAA
jgi:hypothetical protein